MLCFILQTETFGHRVHETVAREGQHHPTDCQSGYPHPRRVPTVQETGQSVAISQLYCAESCSFKVLIKSRQEETAGVQGSSTVCVGVYSHLSEYYLCRNQHKRAALLPGQERSAEHRLKYINKGCCVLQSKLNLGQASCLLFDGIT